MRNLRDSIRLRGVDGSYWPLGGPAFGRQDAYMKYGITGLFQQAPRTPTRTSRAYQIGSTPRMTKIEERLLDFRVRLDGRTRRDLEELWTRWTMAWSFEQDSTLTIEPELNGPREIRVRLDREMRPDVGAFSMQSTSMEIEMVVVACWPFLTSGTDVLEWDFPAGTSSHTFVTNNNTDVPLWMEYGGDPITSAQLPDALSGRMVPIHTQTDVWKVRTRKSLETISSASGTNQLVGLRGVSFLYEIPPRTPIVRLPVTVTASSPGKLRAFMPRHHEMPWG